MKLLGWIITFMFGILIINTLSPKIKTIEKIGFALPIGIGISTLAMMLLDLIGIPINNIKILLGIELVSIVILSIFAYLNNKSFFSPEKPVSEAINVQKLFPINLAWILIMSYSIYAIYSIAAKTMFWPVFIYDSVNGYDFIAKAIVEEGTLNNLIFDPEYPMYSIRSLYPPLVPIAFGISYLFGFTSSKIVVVFFYLSNFIVFYSFIKRYSTHFAAALFSLFFAITPEFAAFSALSSPNPPCTFYTSMGLLSLYIWYKEDIKSYFNLGTLCMMLALWTRTESLIFFAGGGLLILIKITQNKKFIPVIMYGATCLSVFIFWQWHLESVLMVEKSSLIIKYLYWDPDKLLRMLKQVEFVTFSTQYYGIVIYLFIIMLLINIPFIIKHKEGIVLLSIIVVPWILYMLIYYQLNTDYMTYSAGGWLGSGYKRGLFYFIPLLLFYCVNNRIGYKIFNKYLTI